MDNAETVIVHCGRGISRSATLVIATLMVREKLSYTDAQLNQRSSRLHDYVHNIVHESRFALTSSKRACIYPNVGFQLQLYLFEKLDMRTDAVDSPVYVHLSLNSTH